MDKKVIHSLRIKKIKKFFFLLIFSSQLQASQLRGFCFPSRVSLDQVRLALNSIQLSIDKISYKFNENCIEANLEESRNNLYKSFLSSKFPIKRSYSNSTSSTVENCSIELITEQKMSNKIKVRRVGGKLVINDLLKKSDKSKRSTIMVAPGLFAYIDVNDESVGLSCKHRSNGNVELAVKLEAKSQNLSTKVIIRKGQRFNLGSVVENLSTKSQEKSTNKGFDKNQIKGQITSKYFLIVN